MMHRQQQQQQQQQPQLPSSAHTQQQPQHPQLPPPYNTATIISRLHFLARHNPQLAQKLHQMALPLSPLVQLTTGAVHPHFPRTVLQFWLLTDDQLESLAAFYHQRDQSPWSAQYPCPVVWRSDLPLEEKRRRMGRFIGLRGCGEDELGAGAGVDGSSAEVAAMVGSMRTEDEIAEEARFAAADDEVWRRKMNPW
ncbi:hypothetical protein PLIIFM63780_007073 [Purpureocillium lilacinum]|uniref:Beta-xylosidase n=2 Tax=Purpureocillium lilacinum TaxID=33203 RepID=A0A179GVU0_PURLI|nr:beta-xylosidase [Purpureocillium lilacinum]PWI65171.1 hypothetical protein PCL_07348 [Purpureocillium lilacinum]GJN73010.1 hypothetical protein PLICBS_007086 [Purpureocillium lilacinum]GJN83524.1 hypothetical protein PLIIFM63780_007073 [Purpureocillium lilacinum]